VPGYCAEEATYLAKLCKKVYMIVRKDEMRASKAMQHRVENTANMNCFISRDERKFLEKKPFMVFMLSIIKQERERKLDVTRFFVAI